MDINKAMLEVIRGCSHSLVILNGGGGDKNLASFVVINLKISKIV